MCSTKPYGVEMVVSVKCIVWAGILHNQIEIDFSNFL